MNNLWNDYVDRFFDGEDYSFVKDKDFARDFHKYLKEKIIEYLLKLNFTQEEQEIVDPFELLTILEKKRQVILKELENENN